MRSFRPRRLGPFLPILALSTASLTALGGCADEGPGSIVIPVQLGNNKSCEEVGVTQLHAELERGGEIYEETVDCSVGEVRIDDVAPQRYDLLVQGLASDGAAILDNLDQDARVVDVLGDGQTNVIDTVLLTDAPAQLRIGWDFGLSNCASAGIHEFEITAFENGGSAVLLTSAIDCDAPTDAGNLHVVPDPDRDLNGKLLAEAAIQPVDKSGAHVGSPISFSFDPPGPGRFVDLIIECDETGCVEQN